MLELKELFSEYPVVDIIDTNNDNEDYDANMKLYLELYDKGQVEGFTPVLVEKDDVIPWEDVDDINLYKKEYNNKIKNIIEKVKRCYSQVWMGKMLYNYYYDEDMDEYDYNLYTNYLFPEDNWTGKVFSKEIVIKDRIDNFDFKNTEFILLPTKTNWEVMAYMHCYDMVIKPEINTMTGIIKMLYENYGARLLFVCSTVMVLYFPDPIVDEKRFLELAQVLVALDNDLYYYYEMVEETILGNKIVYLWWD